MNYVDVFSLWEAYHKTGTDSYLQEAAHMIPSLSMDKEKLYAGKHLQNKVHENIFWDSSSHIGAYC